MPSTARARQSRPMIAVFLGFCLLAAPVRVPAQAPTSPEGQDDLADIVSPAPPSEFASPDEAMAAFKAAVSVPDLDKLASLLGLNAGRLKATEGLDDTLALIKEGASRRLALETREDHSIIDVGIIMWPFPFPIVKKENGKFAFDPASGIEEIINRRVGENEIQTIETLRGYVDAQEDYALDDHDGDGVLEYAQKLVSSDGRADGLYWPLSEGLGPSPAGPFIDFEQYNERQEDGYFGYRYKVVTRQGDQIAGGAFDYVINGNMIAGFALVAWPVKYGRSGVNTFVVNRNGIIYQADLGADTEKIAPQIRQFNPSDRWSVTED